MSEGPLWHGLTYEELDIQYRGVGVEPAVESAYLDQYVARSTLAREVYGEPIVMPYGQSPAETVRIFKAPGEGPRPTLINLKGGWWRIPGAGWVDFVALGMIPHGVHVVSIDYGTMPNFSMKELVEQVANGVAWTIEHAREYNIDPNNLHLVGHSAGAHLAATMRGLQAPGIPFDAIKSTTSASGVYDLGFALHGHLSRGERAIHLSAKDAETYSPVSMQPLGRRPITFLAGEMEPPEFHRQAREIAALWQGVGAQYESIPGANHYSLYLRLDSPDSDITQSILSQMSQ